MNAFGLDISDTLLRLASIERRGRSWQVHVRAEIPVPAGYIVDGDIKQPVSVIDLLKTLLQAANVKTSHVTFALPERHTFVKLVSLPSSNRPLPQTVAEAISQHFPYSPDEVYWDWHRVNRQNSLGQTQVLLGAAPRTTVDEYLHVLTEAGLKVDVAEIESLAITRALLGPTPSDETVIIVDLGRTRSTLILVEKGIVQFSSTLRYAGRELNQFISDELHITSEQADRAKKLFGLDPKRGKGLLRKALLPHINAIADGISDVEAFYQEHYPDHRPIQRILLNGSGALLRGIDVELRSLLEHPVEVATSWMYTQLREHDPGLPPDIGFTYTTVFGLALQPYFPTE